MIVSSCAQDERVGALTTKLEAVGQANDQLSAELEEMAEALRKTQWAESESKQRHSDAVEQHAAEVASWRESHAALQEAGRETETRHRESLTAARDQSATEILDTEEAARAAEEARRRQIEAEKKRQAWEAARDLARYKAAAKKAQQLLEGAQDYLRVNPGTPNLIIISEAVIKLANALKAKNGADVEKTVSNLKAIVAKSEEFTGHLEKLVTARQERERKTIANKVETLTAYKEQISKFIAANIASNIEAVQKLLPLVKVIDDVLSNPDLPGVLAAEAQVQKVIFPDKNRWLSIAKQSFIKK